MAEKSSNDSICSINIAYPVFSSTSASVNAKFGKLNSAIETYVDTVGRNAYSQAEELMADIAGMADSPAGLPDWNCELLVESSAFLSERMASVLFTTYSYLGGAHGMTEYKAVNFDIRSGKILGNEQLLDYSETDRINELLENGFENPDGCFWEKPSLDKASAIVMEEDAVKFIYEQYVLGPYRLRSSRSDYTGRKSWTACCW
ncbi:MAG: DUF4163 domain-containing protein [Alistipes putredinis]|nr:MAG: DUF4163 domain-containing protein [Alistipes putredinis]